jgi:tetratricopeptide (TPR) repeat protein
MMRRLSFFSCCSVLKCRTYQDVRVRVLNIRYNLGTAASIVLLVIAAVSSAIAESDYERGIELRIQGKNKLALEAFEHVSASSGLFLDALLQRGAILEDLGSVKKAIAVYRRILEISPHNKEAQRNLNHLLAAKSIRVPEPGPPLLQRALISQVAEDIRDGLTEKARMRLRMLRALFPDAPEPVFYMALILESRGDHKQAEEVLREIIEKKPSFAPAIVHLTVSLLTAGRTQDAQEVLMEGLAVLPQDPRLRYLARIQNPIKKQRVHIKRNQLSGGIGN